MRIDIDARAAPDVVGSISNMRGLFENGLFDAVWCSHCIEHLDDHEVLPALREFNELTDGGFAILSCPNLDADAIAKLLASEDVESVAESCPWLVRSGFSDMIFGHSPSIEAGRMHMAHKTGFTVNRLGRLALNAGFAEARVAWRRKL